jgi:hypothetical protein
MRWRNVSDDVETLASRRSRQIERADWRNEVKHVAAARMLPLPRRALFVSTV